MEYASNEPVTSTTPGYWKQPAGKPLSATPSRSVAFGATDGSEVTFYELTTPHLFYPDLVPDYSTVASGTSGSITVEWRWYVDDVLIETVTQTVGFGATDDNDPIWGSTAIGSGGYIPLYCNKFKITTKVTANTLDAGNSTLSTTEALRFAPVTGE